LQKQVPKTSSKNKFQKQVPKTSSKNKFNTSCNPIPAINLNYLSEHSVRIESESYMKSYGKENERYSNNMRKKVIFWTSNIEEKR